MEIKLTEAGKRETKYFSDILIVPWTKTIVSLVLMFIRVLVVAAVSTLVGYFTLGMLFFFILEFRDAFTPRFE